MARSVINPLHIDSDPGSAVHRAWPDANQSTFPKSDTTPRAKKSPERPINNRPKPAGVMRQIEADIFIRCANHEFARSARYEIRATPSDHVAKGSRRHRK